MTASDQLFGIIEQFVDKLIVNLRIFRFAVFVSSCLQAGIGNLVLII